MWLSLNQAGTQDAAFRSTRSALRWRSLGCGLAVGLFTLAGCSTSSRPAISPSESPVLVGTEPNSLPTPPAQATSNRYAGVDVSSGGTSWNWEIDQPTLNYTWQQQQGVLLPQISSGVYQDFGDFNLLSDGRQTPFSFSGLDAEISGGVSLFLPAPGGFAGTDLVIGSLQEPNHCLAPHGSVTIDFLQLPSLNLSTPTTDTLYGQTTLAYSNGIFSYTNTAEMTATGAPATTSLVPFLNSVCVSAQAGYALQSESTAEGTTTQNTLSYLGVDGLLAGTTSYLPAAATLALNAGFVGSVEPSAPVDLSAVTKGSYRGFYEQSSGSSANLAYFGTSSAWITTPVFKQTATQLVGGNQMIGTYQYTIPATPVTGNILLDFGAQDAKHPGLFPAATFKEQDVSDSCSAAQQSTGSDGMTYCTFPVVALVHQSYGKYAIFLAGPEPTYSSTEIFYALVQD